MNRRKAIRNILLAAGVTAVAGTGYKWYSITKKPHLDELNNYKELLSELAETIIPKTNTPGAKDAHVGEFIQKMILDCTDVKAQNKFLYGLQDVEDHCHSRYGQSFVKCTVPQREETLNYFEQKDKLHGGIIGKVQHKFLGDPFIKTLKDYTVMGYCTSMEGATMGLAYDYVPGAYLADLPLQPGQRSWATK